MTTDQILFTDVVAHLAAAIASLEHEKFDKKFPRMYSDYKKSLEKARTYLNQDNDDLLRTACALTSVNWTLSADQIYRLYKQVEQARELLTKES